MRIAISVLAILTLTGCSDSSRDTSAPAGPEAEALEAILREAPSIRGVLTGRLGGDRILVEEDPDEIRAYAKAWVDLERATRVFRADGTRASTDDLTSGLLVSVWFTGPVRESYPVQAVGDVVLIEGEAER